MAKPSIIGSFKNLGGSMLDAVKRVPQHFEGSSGALGFAKRAFVAVPDMASRAFRGPMGPLAVIGTGLAAIAGASAIVRSGQQQKAYDEHAQTMDALAQSMQPQQVSYKNSVNPYEAAMLDQRMREGGANGSMGDKVMADRLAAQQANVPPASV